MVVSDNFQMTNPQTAEEDTPLEFPEIPAGSSSGATTTDIRPTGRFLDSGYISKSPLKAIFTEATKVPTVGVKTTAGIT